MALTTHTRHNVTTQNKSHTRKPVLYHQSLWNWTQMHGYYRYVFIQTLLL